MKGIVAHHEISAAESPLASDQEQRIADAASKTLGTLVGTLLGSYVTTDAMENTSERDARDDIMSFKMKVNLHTSIEDYDRIQSDLTPVDAAVRWVAERHPDHLPAKYGCSSWWQVIHESRLFKLRYRDVDGRSVAWYRAKHTQRKLLQ